MTSRALALVVLAGCATHAAAPATPHAPAGPLAAAALPYEVLDARTGHSIAASISVIAPQLAHARAVCIGEDHQNPHHHWVQLEVARALVAAWHGAPVALGMEMVQRPFQGVLDDYAAGKIDAAALRSRAGWDDRWGYDYGFYGPTIDTVVSAHGALLALNASREITKQVAHHGLDSLSPAERAQLPELKLDDAAHRAWFDALMEDMGGASAHSSSADGKPPADDMPTADNVYTVQVIWDETMADTAAKWLAAHPGGHAILLAGNGHCHDSAIVGRLKRRGITDAISIRPILSTDDVADLLAKPINDYVVVLTAPPGPAPKE
ncbi:MAG TPA: ChaN family lipoprotein [Kofleriaceae bacterium]|jgi:uncharacterized iron-regulated protein